MKASEFFSMLKQQQAAMVAALQSAGLSGPAIEETLRSAGLSSRQISEKVEERFPGSTREVWEARANELPETKTISEMAVETLKKIPVPPDHYVIFIPGSGWRCRPLAAPRQQQPRRQRQPRQGPAGESGEFHRVGPVMVSKSDGQYVVRFPDGSEGSCAATSAALHQLMRDRGVIGQKTRYALPPELRG